MRKVDKEAVYVMSDKYTRAFWWERQSFNLRLPGRGRTTLARCLRDRPTAPLSLASYGMARQTWDDTYDWGV